MASQTKKTPLPITVSKPTPYTFDLGLLLASDPNPLPSTASPSLETVLATTARDGAQALLNQLLSTCAISSTPSGVLLSLPAIATPLPREKPLPPPKKETTWSRFAAKKGIKAKSAEARKKLVYEEATGEWVPKWGYKGRNKEGEGDWIVEVDDKVRKEGQEQRGDGRRERKERVRRNERLQRKNERGQKRGGK